MLGALGPQPSTAGQAAAPPEKVIDFDREIRPILSDNCFTCHGPDEGQRQVDLRLDTREGVFADRGGYRLIVPASAAASRLFQRVSAEDRRVRMPPPNANRNLAPAQVDLIRRWIDQGAPWQNHWAYTAPVRPLVPATKPGAWGRNPIDAFVLARLEAEGLRPARDADRTTLIRRLTLDLTGLPPTPAEVDAFLADGSARGYDNLVDRLLASPRYGERMALQWLDLARYADTHGYHIDSHRDMWRWRDWVIEAFNRNMPYDRFTVAQLAGDLLPNATLEDRIATGFNRNHMINYEGGAIPEEYLNEYIVDRVETTSVAWMGTTLGCARCHDHKYDPIKQKEFYQFYAFFNNVAEKGLDGRTGNAEPVIDLASQAEQSELARLDREIADGEGKLQEAEIARLQTEWEKTRAGSLPVAPRDGLLAHYELDGTLADTSGRYRHGKILRGDVTWTGGPLFRAAELGGQTEIELGEPAVLEATAPFSLAVWLRPSGGRAMAALAKLDPSADRRGYELAFDDTVHVGDQKRGAYLYFRLVHRAPGDAIEIRTPTRLIQREWVHVAVTNDGSGRAAGLKIYLDARPAPIEVLRDSLSGSIRSARPLGSGDLSLGNPYNGALDDLRLYDRELPPSEIESLAVHEPVRLILSGLAGKRDKGQQEALRRYFLARDAPEEMRALHGTLEKLKRARAELKKTIPSTMVMNELPERRETFVLGRGDYRNKGEKVTPGVPAVFPPMPPGAPRDRLGLARWLVDPRHPLTARVAVNRFWQMLFGTGFVKTAENFGTQGERPSHPELLDWLATEFARTGWDVKALLGAMVRSSTYRQASMASRQLVERDPENRLLARGPRFRLPAEIVRDNALAASGLLNEARGGPPVFPYQPKGIWEEIAYGDVFTAQTYTPSRGKDLYRRSMYTFWKRTAPPPSLAAFDAPDREKCVARRLLTNTPLQALVLMNDPTYVEAARALAARVMREAGRDPGARIARAFRLTTGRKPSRAESDALRGVAEAEWARFRADRGGARRLLGVGESPVDSRLDPAELAAWTMVATTILNLDETITKE